MRPLFHPSLVNGRYDDPTVYVETLFEKRSLLFDLGEVFSLSPRKIRRIDQIFVSHAHIDHFVGFDHLLRLLIGQEKSVKLFGPSGFAGRVFHTLQAYRWNLRMEPDARIINLETAVTRSNDLAYKGINYRVSPENAACLAAFKIDSCVLANNHVLDWGRSGLRETLATLEKLNIISRRRGAQ
jgi:ribonuclease BN (tRNA processing enzyme)